MKDTIHKKSLNEMIVKVGSNQLELVDFTLSSQSSDGRWVNTFYGINVAKVLEIIPMDMKMSKVPGGHPCQEGIISHRSGVVPIINLGRYFGLMTPPHIEEENLPIIISEFAGLRIGFVVHGVNRIRRLSWTDIKPIDLPQMDERNKRQVIGVAILEKEQELLVFLDVESISEDLGFFRRQQEMEDSKKQNEQNGKTVLLADDSATARKLVSKILSKEGYSIVQVENGQEAIDLFMKSPGQFDIVVSDVEMPVMDGYTLTKKLRALPEGSKIPILLHSSMSGEANIQKGKESGADNYLVKFEPQKVLDAVKELLEKR